MSTFPKNLAIRLKCLIYLCICLIVILYTPETASAGQHCGAENDWRSHLVPDYWPPRPVRHIKSLDSKLLKPVGFYNACKRHDDCYDTYGRSRSSCDKKFYKDMKKQCQKVYDAFWDLPQRKACEGAAYGYYQAVVKNGRPAYLSAQKSAAPQINADDKLQTVKK